MSGCLSNNPNVLLWKFLHPRLISIFCQSSLRFVVLDYEVFKTLRAQVLRESEATLPLFATLPSSRSILWPWSSSVKNKGFGIKDLGGEFSYIMAVWPISQLKKSVSFKGKTGKGHSFSSFYRYSVAGCDRKWEGVSTIPRKCYCVLWLLMPSI